MIPESFAVVGAILRPSSDALMVSCSLASPSHRRFTWLARNFSVQVKEGKNPIIDEPTLFNNGLTFATTGTRDTAAN